MPYSKGYRKPYKKTYRKRYNKGRLSRPQYNATKRIVKKELDKEIENKQLFINNSTNSITDTGTAFSMTSTLSQGFDAADRLGDAVTAKRLTTYFNIRNNDTFSRIVRCILIKTIGPEITWTKSLLFYYSGSQTEVNSPINWPEMSGRGKILYDKRVVISAQAEVGYEKCWKHSIKLNHRVNYDRSGNTQRGQLVWFIISDDTAGGNTLNMTHMLSYQDA